METAVISRVNQSPTTSDQKSLREQENAALAVILSEIDKQLLMLGYAACHGSPLATESDPRHLRIHGIAAPGHNERWMSHEFRSHHGLRPIWMGVLLLAFGLASFVGSYLYRHFEWQDELTDGAAVNVVVERIIGVESNGDANAKNGRSSATGLGQFLSETWLDLIRTYRPDLSKGRSESKLLELRREAKLAREITTRFVERNAAMLRQRGLPVTAGTIYLAHFAGSAGAVAILSAPDNADAALIMANADATGRTKREQIIKANPFLEYFTVADLKVWANRKMNGPHTTMHSTTVAACCSARFSTDTVFNIAQPF